MHKREDEHFLVLEGTLRIFYGGDVFDLEPGRMATLAKGIPHAWAHRSSSPVRMVVLVNPGGCEGALPIVAAGAFADLAALAKQFEVTVLGDTPI